MKKIIPVLIFLLLPTAVFAKNQQAGSAASPASTPINTWAVVRERNLIKTRIKNEIKEQTKEEAREEAKEQLREKLQEKNQNRIRTYYGRLNTRIDAAIKRLQTLSERILTRLNILEEEGENVKDLKTKVENAQTLIANAKDLQKDLQGLVEQMLESEDPKSFMPTLKDGVMEIKDALKDVYSILLEVVREIQGLKAGTET